MRYRRRGSVKLVDIYYWTIRKIGSLFQTKQFLTFPLGLLHVFLLWGIVISVNAGNRVVAWGAGTNSNQLGNNFGQSVVPANVTNAVMVSAGRWHSIVLNGNGTLQGWGSDQLGQTDFPAGSNYISIASGYLFSVALRSDGRVVATGDNDVHGETDVPANLSNVVAVACGWYHGLALKSDGTVVSWGTDTNPAAFGQDQVSYGQSVVPTGLSNVVAVAGGGFHSMALRSDGTVVAWGAGRVFDPSNGIDDGQAIVPGGLSNVVAIAAGGFDSLALKSNGQLVVWGDNFYGQTNIPASLTNGVAAIAAGGWHNLALLTNGTVVAWGAGVSTNTHVGFGQNIVPGGLTNVIQIAAGLYNSLALAGTNLPRVKAVLNISHMETNGIVITSPARNGKVYRLEYSDNLTNSDWSAFSLQAGTGSTNRFVDPNRAAALRFYRVSQW